MTVKVNADGFDTIAALVREQFDMMPGSRAAAARETSLAPAAISHILTGRRKSWIGIKALIRSYRKNNPGFGDWHNVGILLKRKFPEESEWQELIDG